MRICMVIPEMLPSDDKIFVGGSVSSLISLCKSLVANRHEVTIITGTSRCGRAILADSEFPWAKINPIEIKSPRVSLEYGMEFLIKSPFEIIRHHKSTRFDIIHSHSGYPSYAIISAIMAGLLRLPAIHTLYCPVADRTSGAHTTSVLSLGISRESLRYLDRLIAISGNVAETVEKLGLPRRKIAVIPPGIDSSVFSPLCSGLQVRRTLQITEDTPLILFVGNLTKTKGIDVLFPAMAKVIEQYGSARLIITLELEHKGFEDRWGKLESEAKRLGILDNITRLGVIKNMPDVMGASDLVVVPWLNTAGPSDYPIVALEAMAIGKPVLATNVGGIPEIITHGRTGFLVKPNEVDTLSQHILMLLERRELRNAVGKAASKFVLDNFAMEKIGLQTERLYEDVMRAT